MGVTAMRAFDCGWSGHCCECGVPMALDAETYSVLKRSGANFYCPHGHPQHFPRGKTVEQKLRDELTEERRRRERAEQRIAMEQDERKAIERKLAAQKGQTTRLKNRAKAGVCPCCNRTFKQLAAHMKSQHPEFQAAD